MSRITGSEVANLMGAYNAVYAPQVNEEQVSEEKVDEAIGQPGSAGMVNWKDQNTGQVRSGYKSSSDGKLYRNYNDALAARNSRTQVAAATQGMNRTFAAGGGAAAVAQGRNPLDVFKQGSTNLQRQQAASAPAARPATPAPAARPATPAPAARPATPAPSLGAKTAPATVPTSTTASAAKPALGPTGKPLVGGIERRTPTRQEMEAAAAKRAAASSSSATLKQDFDIFDIIKGHLIDEGYAETEEAALQIMANMSEEWREEILEADNIGSRLWNAAAKGFTGYGTPDNDWVAKGVNMAARTTLPGIVATGARALAGAPKAISAAQRTYNPPTSRPATPAPATPTRPAPPASNSGGSPAPARPTPTASSTVLAKQGGVEGRLDKSTGKFTAGKFSDAESSRYSSRTATQTPKTSPTSTTPSTGPKINQDVADLRRMQSASLMRQQNRNLPNGKIPTSNDLDAQKVAGKAATPVASTGAAPEVKQTAAIAAAPRPITPNPSAPGAGKEDMMKKQLNQHFDPFDSILEYLVAEGYADTNNAAIKIMANMSEEWRESVLESFASQKRLGELGLDKKKPLPPTPLRKPGAPIGPVNGPGGLRT